MSLRWYQTEAVESAWRHLCTQAGNPIIVAPTGSGKSHMLAQLARDAVDLHAGRVMILAHRKELLEQNADKLGRNDVGLYSAGLGQRNTEAPIVVAGIQSVYQRAHEFGERHLVLVDEVHLVPFDGEGQYRRFLDGLRSANPRLRMVGMTATPYRLDCGPICRPDGMFQRVCYSVDIPRLINEGYLCRLTSKQAVGHIDSSQLRIRGGEFAAGQMQDEFGRMVGVACREIVRRTEGRHSVLVFASGVRHAEDVASELEALTGERVGVVTGETPGLLREEVLSAFKRMELRWLVNCDVLTTGFDAPVIDAIAVLRATMSPGLFAQMVGRGFRVHESKTDCLVLDFGENIDRHGPIDSPEYGVDKQRGGGASAGEAPVKSCPNCQRECLISAKSCDCGYEFPPSREGAFIEPTEQSILAEPVTWQVEQVNCQVWKKKGWQEGDPRTLRVNYFCMPLDSEGGNLEGEWIAEWVCVEHEGFAGNKAAQWWQARCSELMPTDADYAALLFDEGKVARPRTITTIRDGRWYRIVGCELDPIPDEVEASVYDDEVPF